MDVSRNEQRKQAAWSNIFCPYLRLAFRQQLKYTSAAYTRWWATVSSKVRRKKDGTEKRGLQGMKKRSANR